MTRNGRSDIALFHHLVGAHEDRVRNFEAEHPRGLHVEDQLEPRRLLDRKLGRFRSSQNLGGELGRLVTTEAGLYGVVGAVAGLVIGIPYAWLAIISLGVEWPLQVPVVAVAVVVVVLAALTAGAGLLPARRAARVSPVAALHSIW